ncbi:MAG: helix-turn-helix domain-containing protein [Chthoniobacterales bacterium]|nr:helix-turn-helix domain-containing protein [Chthoniobacterales bacterium]
MLGVAMGTNYEQLSLEERCKISLLREKGKTIQQIAAALARSPSSITREIKRNRAKALDYDPYYAQQL